MGMPSSSGLMCSASAATDITGAITITWGDIAHHLAQENRNQGYHEDQQ